LVLTKQRRLRLKTKEKGETRGDLTGYIGFFLANVQSVDQRGRNWFVPDLGQPRDQ